MHWLLWLILIGIALGAAFVLSCAGRVETWTDERTYRDIDAP